MSEMDKPYFQCPVCGSPFFGRNPDTGVTKCHGSSSGPIICGDHLGQCDWRGVWPEREEGK